MGFSLSWIAVKDISVEKLFETIGVEKTGEFSECPEEELCYLDRMNGWRLIIANHDCLMESKVAWLTELSSDREVISVFVEEHVMYSAACCWRNGKREWFVEHDCERGLEDVKTEGVLPECFQEVHDGLMAELRNDKNPCDYLFDVPVEIGRRLTGFVHDRTMEDLDEEVYWELVIR
jgi:hypothetical protein